MFNCKDLIHFYWVLRASVWLLYIRHMKYIQRHSTDLIANIFIQYDLHVKTYQNQLQRRKYTNMHITLSNWLQITRTEELTLHGAAMSIILVNWGGQTAEINVSIFMASKIPANSYQCTFLYFISMNVDPAVGLFFPTVLNLFAAMIFFSN